MRPRRLLVLGLGNVLCGDDGLGVAAVTRLAAGHALPPEVHVADGGTLGLALLGWLEGFDELLLVDAVLGEGAPGSPVRLEGEDIPAAVRERLSVHQIGVADLLDAQHLLGGGPRRVTLLGRVPDTLELGLRRSPAVERALPGLVEELAEEIRRRGHAIEAKGLAATPDAPGAPLDRAARALGL